MEEYKDKYEVLTTESGCKELLNVSRDKWGYYDKKIDGRTTKIHRWVYEMVCGPIPDGLVIRHTCDNPACVNIDHLLIGTHADNVADKVSRGRQAKGTSHGRTKLTEEQVRLIRNSTEEKGVLAAKFGVDRRLITAIQKREIWKHLPD